MRRVKSGAAAAVTVKNVYEIFWSLELQTV